MTELLSHAAAGAVPAGALPLMPSGSALSSDLELITAVKDGDSRAFAVLADRYRARIYQHCLRKTLNPVASEDLTQEVLLRIHRAMGRYQTAHSFYTWVYRITANLCIDYFRRRQCQPDDLALRPEAGMDQQLPDQDPAFVRRPADPGEVLLSKELTRIVRDAIDALPASLRDILKLRDLEGYSYGEIAERLGTTSIKVKARLFRARRSLRRTLSPYVHPEETPDTGQDDVPMPWPA